MWNNSLFSLQTGYYSKFLIYIESVELPQPPCCCEYCCYHAQKQLTEVMWFMSARRVCDTGCVLAPPGSPWSWGVWVLSHLPVTLAKGIAGLPNCIRLTPQTELLEGKWMMYETWKSGLLAHCRLSWHGNHVSCLWIPCFPLTPRISSVNYRQAVRQVFAHLGCYHKILKPGGLEQYFFS